MLLRAATQIKTIGNGALLSGATEDAEAAYTAALASVAAARDVLHAGGKEDDELGGVRDAEAVFRAVSRKVDLDASVEVEGKAGDGGGKEQDDGIEATVEAQLLCNRARVRCDRGDVEGAIHDARAAVSVEPAWGKAHYRLATALELSGRPAEAISVVDSAVHAVDRDAAVAQLRRLRGRIERAGAASARIDSSPVKPAEMGSMSPGKPATATSSARLDFTAAMPSACFDTVFSFLERRAAVGGSLARVSKRWYDEALSFAPFWRRWTSAMTRAAGRLSLDDALLVRWATVHGDALEALDLQRAACVTNEGLAEAIGRCSRLKELSLSDCTCFGDSGILSAATLSTLRSLSLCGADGITSAAVVAVVSANPALEKLALDSSAATDDALRAVAEKCLGLVELRLQPCVADFATGPVVGGADGASDASRSNDIGVTGAGGAGESAGMHTSGRVCSEEGLAAVLGGCTALRSLSVACWERWRMTDAMFAMLATGCGPQLEVLELAHLSQAAPDVLSEVGVCEGLRACTRLRRLALPFGEAFVGAGVMRTVAELPVLKALDLTECPEASSEIVVVARRHSLVAFKGMGLDSALFDAEPHFGFEWGLLGPGGAPVPRVNPFDAVVTYNRGDLLTFEVEGNAGVSDTTLRVLATNCPLLTALNVTRCETITEDGMLSVARGAQHLSILRADGLHGAVTDAVLKALSSKALSVLAAGQFPGLRLTKSCYISDTGLKALAARGSHLRSLSLFGQDYITDAGLVPVIRAASRLEDLSVSACDRVTDVALSFLAHGCPRLSYLDVSGCRMCGDEGLLLLATCGLRDLLTVEATGCDVSDDLRERFAAACRARLKL